MNIDDLLGHFSLWGDFDADAVTSRLGLPRSAIYRKGETSLSDQPNLITTWDLYCPADVNTAEEQIEYLLMMLWPHADALCELTARFHGELNVVGAADLHVAPTTMQKLAQLNLTLNFFNYRNEPNLEAAVSA